VRRVSQSGGIVSAELAESLRFGDKVSFYHDVPQILHRLRSENVIIAACSRTTATAL
jgi:hypothetical protein